MSTNPHFFAVLPSNVRYSPIIDNEAKLLYAEITAHTNEYGICRISVQDLADIFEIDSRKTHKLLHSLKDNGFIFGDLSDGGFQKMRELSLKKEDR